MRYFWLLLIPAIAFADAATALKAKEDYAAKKISYSDLNKAFSSTITESKTAADIDIAYAFYLKEFPYPSERGRQYAFVSWIGHVKSIPEAAYNRMVAIATPLMTIQDTKDTIGAALVYAGVKAGIYTQENLSKWVANDMAVTSLKTNPALLKLVLQRMLKQEDKVDAMKQLIAGNQTDYAVIKVAFIPLFPIGKSTYNYIGAVTVIYGMNTKVAKECLEPVRLGLAAARQDANLTAKDKADVEALASELYTQYDILGLERPQ